jgi:hypothetical protein
MKTLKIISIVSTVFLILACSTSEKQSSLKTAVIKQPEVTISPADRKFGGTSVNKKQQIKIQLPSLIWDSYKTEMISLKAIGTGYSAKGEFCVIDEISGKQLQINSKVEIIDESDCLYSRMNSSNGIPKHYIIGLIKIRVIDTGEEGWTWTKSINFSQE